MTAPRLIDVIEVWLERCGLLYGEGLCQAALGVTGDRKCYNTLITCQDRVNFDAADAGTPEVPAGIGGYVAHYGSTSGTTSTHTITGVDFGAVAVAGSVRQIVLAISVQGSPTLTGAAIGGVTATVDASRAVSTTSRVYLVRAAVPTGTSGTVVLTFSANLAQSALRVGVFRLIDVDAVADTDGVNGVNTSGPTTVSLSLTVPANSFVIAAATTVFLFGITTMTGVTRRYSQSISSGAAYATAGSETVVDADASFDITASAIEDAPINLIAVAYKLHDSEPAVPAAPAGNQDTWRFTRPSDYLAESGIEDLIPSVESISYTPPMIHPGEDVGQRASLKVRFRDHRWGDTGPNGDRYLDERGFDAFKLGTFWGKFRARQLYVRGRKMTRRQTLLGQALDEAAARTFVMEEFDGPTPDGYVEITARDPMQSLFSDRSQCPAITRGTLSADLDETTTTATLVPVGIGDEEYAEWGWVTLSGSEIAAFSRVGDTLTLTRGSWNTTAKSHDAGSRVQLCCDDFLAVTPDYALHRLMTVYGDVPAEYINAGDWAAEIAAYYEGELLTTLIAEPTPTEKLANEIILEVGLSTWWDELAARQRLQIIREIDTDVLVLDARNAPGEANVVAGSLRIADQPKKRISRAEVWYGQINPLEGVDQKNLPAVAVRVASDEETAAGSPAIDKIYSRWIQSGGLPSADAIASRRLARFVRAPRRFTVNLPRWGSIQPVMGQGCRLLLDTHQDDEGNPANVPCQIVSIDPGARGGAEYALTLEEVNIDPRFRPVILPNTVIIEYSQFNVNFLERYLTRYALPEAGDTVTLIINEGVAIGSRDIAVPALEIGDWPTGVNIVVDDRGNVSGKGGDGANGRGGDNNGGYDGGNGGLAFRTTRPIKLKGNGRIQGGGGGGGGGAGDYAGWTGPQRDGGGGGGGAGWPPGAGGAAGGNAEAGKPGTLLAGGQGGRGRSGSGLSTSQHKGGNGGNPAASGGNANGYSPGDGGSPGAAVVGWSLIDTSEWTGTVVGSTL